MRITFISPAANLSGGLRVIAIYADHLQARGHDVIVVAQRHRAITWKDHVKAWMRGTNVKRPPGFTHYDAMQTPLRVIDHDGPVAAADVPDSDIVIATWWETAFAVMTLPPQKGQKVYFIQGHEVFSHLPSHLSAGSYYLPMKKVTIAGWLVDTMADLYGDHDVALVPNSVDLELFHAAERGRQAVPTVGLIYSPTHFKGVDVATRALAELRKTYPDLRVVAFGTQTVRRDLPLPKGARYVQNPPQDRLRDLYAGCDVFISASRSEGFGLPILEAMACRTPVVATRTGCAPDVITDAVEGYVVEIGDAAQLAQRLAQVLDLPEAAWKRMSDAAFARATQYTWEDACTLFERAIGADQAKM